MYTKPFPGNYKITSGFKPANRPNHTGIDWGCPKGTPLFAILGGKVTFSGLDQFGGAYIDIKLDNDYLARYIHLSRLDVKKGQRVEKGQQIGLSGGVKGEWGAGQSTGAHLHLAISKNGNASGFYDYKDIINDWNNNMPQVQSFNNSDIPTIVNKAGQNAGQQALTLFQVQAGNAKLQPGYMRLPQSIRDCADSSFYLITNYFTQCYCDRLDDIERLQKENTNLKAEIKNLKNK
jgi:hypothetical protein